MPEFSKPGDLVGRGLWKTLYDRLRRVPLCRECTAAERDAAALAIVNATYKIRIDDPYSGCVKTSENLITELTISVAGARMASDIAPSSSIWGSHTWMTVTTPCFTFRLVAWWWAQFRHQSVLVESACRPGHRDYETVVEGLRTLNRCWYTYPGWAGGESEIGVSTGLVEDGF